MSHRLKIYLAAGAGFLLCVVIVITGPRPLEASVSKTKPEVTVEALKRYQIKRSIPAYGPLTPRQSLPLTSQVGGEISWVNPALIAGGAVDAGEDLFTIDPQDYEIAVAIAEAKLAQSEANIDLERGRSENAKREWHKWQTIQGEQVTASALALREPQQADARALSAIHRAELSKAKLDLKRTTVSAPWSASIVATNAVIGKITGVGDVVATLFPIDYGIVELQVPLKALRTLDQGIAEIRLRPVDAPDGPAVLGTFQSVVPNLGADTRLATVRVRIEQPLEQPGWTFGMHLSAEIEINQQRQVTEVPADLIVSGNLIWLYRGGLATRQLLEPVSDADGVVTVVDRFEANDQLIIARPIGLFDGAEVTAIER